MGNHPELQKPHEIAGSDRHQVSEGTGFVGACGEPSWPTGISLMRRQVGTKVCSEAEASLPSPSSPGGCISLQGIHVWRMDDGGMWLYYSYPPQYIFSSSRCRNTTPESLALIKVFCACIVVPMNVSDGG